MNLRFTYDTYQDVRQNLFGYSAPFLVVAGFFTYLKILPPTHQNAMAGLLEYVSTAQPWKGLLGTGLGIGIFIGLAFLLVEVFQVHDQWYDKYVIRWRQRYATDFILPRLVQPFASALNYRFREEAATHTEQFQEQLFYPFVGGRDLKLKHGRSVWRTGGESGLSHSSTHDRHCQGCFRSGDSARPCGPCDCRHCSSARLALGDLGPAHY